MKKNAKKLLLNRETLQLLADESLGQPRGGIHPIQKTQPPPATAVACTATCIC